MPENFRCRLLNSTWRPMCKKMLIYKRILTADFLQSFTLFEQSPSEQRHKRRRHGYSCRWSIFFHCALNKQFYWTQNKLEGLNFYLRKVNVNIQRFHKVDIIVREIILKHKKSMRFNELIKNQSDLQRVRTKPIQRESCRLFHDFTKLASQHQFSISNLIKFGLDYCKLLIFHLNYTIFVASTTITTPPIAVQANPMTIPGWYNRSEIDAASNDGGWNQAKVIPKVWLKLTFGFTPKIDSTIVSSTKKAESLLFVFLGKDKSTISL